MKNSVFIPNFARDLPVDDGAITQALVSNKVSRCIIILLPGFIFQIIWRQRICIEAGDPPRQGKVCFICTVYGILVYRKSQLTHQSGIFIRHLAIRDGNYSNVFLIADLRDF